MKGSNLSTKEKSFSQSMQSQFAMFEPGAVKDPGPCETRPGSSTRQNAMNDLRKQEVRQRKRLPSGNRFFNDELREVYARFIDWSIKRSQGYFITLTFRDYQSSYQAERALVRWLGMISDKYRLIGADGLRAIVAKEWQKRAVIHYHVILLGNDLHSLSRMRIENTWQKITWSYARCYNAEPGSAPYLAKYCSKALGGDLKVYGSTWRGLNIPLSIGRVQIGEPGSRLTELATVG